MKKAFWIGCLALSATLFAARPAYSSVLLVDDDKVQCPTAQFTTIQAAVNAASSGDVIRVCAGTYAEQVSISASLTLRADNGVLLIPSNVIQNSNGVTGDDPIAAVILVDSAADVIIDGFIVDGSSNGLTGCSPRLVGIYFQNSSGRIRHNAVRHMNLGPTNNGCQSGNGIEVESSSGSSSSVTVRDNSVWDYQKNGITGNETGTELLADGNVVTGVGPTTGAAQNGIQIGFGAGGKLTNNTVSDNIWSPCSSPDVCETNATGILVFESNSVVVRNNSLASNQIGVFNGGGSSRIAGNSIANSVTLIGIALVGDDNVARDNTLTHADEAAIYVQGNGNDVARNVITDAGIGVLKISGFSGNVISGNQFFACLIGVQDPPAKHSLGVSPSR